MAIETFEGLPIVDTGGRSLISALDAKKISFPNDGADFGNSGDQLRSLGNGGVEWAAPGMPTYEQTEQALSNWLDEHPEAVTTVEDGAITDAKLNDALKRGLIYGFETVADMKAAATLKAGMVCHTNGFHSSGDGGDAWYKISATGTANEMDVIACGELFANLIIMGDSVTPEMFGAYGDGLQNDTPFINYAIQKAYENGICLKLISLYSIENTINVNLPISIYGDGTVGRFKDSLSDFYVGFNTGFIQNFEGVGINVVKSGAYGQVFKGGTFSGFGITPSASYYQSPNCIGIELNAVSHLIFDTVACNKYENGIGVNLRNGGQYLNFTNCLFDANKYGIKTSVYPDDTVQFFGGCNIQNCYFDCNSNGTLYNSNPKEGSYGIWIDKSGTWAINENRFQGIEYCVYIEENVTSTICIANNRFEMFTYAIYTKGSYTLIDNGNMFDGYLGSSNRVKIPIYIAAEANYTKICGMQNIASCNYLPVKDYGRNTIRNDIQRFSIMIAEINASTYIALGVSKYYGVISNLKFTTGYISTSDGFGNSDTDYWSFIPSGYSGTDNLNTIDKEWGTTRYEPLVLIDKRNDSTNAHAVQPNIEMSLYIGKTGNPEAIKNCLITFDYLPLTNY